MNRLLLIDDDVRLTTRLQKILESEHFQVMAALDGETGIRMAREHVPDAIVCDVQMPELSGFAVLTRLRSSPVTEHIPFVFLTGMAAREHRVLGHQEGADAYLTKPVDPAELVAVIHRQLQRNRGHQRRLERLHGEITSAVPHEMRTPLNGILGMATLMKSFPESLQEDPAQLREMGDTIEYSARRLQRMIESYLLFANLSAGLHLAPADDARAAVQISQRVLGVATRYRRDSRLVLQVGPEDDAFLSRYTPFLEKIAQELVDNACKFSDPDSRVWCSLSVSDEQAFIIEVRDGGPGMSPEEIAGIGAFTQFRRGEREQQGSGLGLHLTRMIAESLGGHLELRTPQGGGLTARVSVPLEKIV